MPRPPVACLLHPARVIRTFFPLLAIVAAAPFERPLSAVPGGFTLTTVEAVMMAAMALVVVFDWRRLWAGRSTPLLVPGGAFLAALACAAILAPAEHGNAARFVARMVMAAALFVVAARVTDTAARARAIARTMLAVAAGVAAIAVLEVAQVPAVMKALTAFRPGFHVVAGQLRATSTLFYPTITSMYLEVAFALGLWLLLAPSSRRPRLERAVVFAALTIVAAGIAATFTRAGLLAMGAAIGLIGALRLTRVPRAHAGFGTLTALAASIVAIVFLFHTPELLATRLTTEGSQAWYGARYRAPATLDFSTGSIHRVPIGVTNLGRLVWDSTRDPAFAMAYHWLRSGSEEVVQFDGVRTAFPRTVAPGETVSFEADVIAPGQPGSYVLVWDVVHESRAWLSTEGVTPARTRVTVSGAPVTAVVTTMNRLPTASVTPPRPRLWSAALQMAADHPLLGVGPDNYRHGYGRYLGIGEWDRRVHANNMYLEILTGAGVPGLLTLLWLIAAAGVALWRRAQLADGSAHAAALAALAVWITIAGHGLVDSFLGFTTTYVTFAVAAGLAFSPGLLAHSDDAHRV